MAKQNLTSASTPNNDKINGTKLADSINGLVGNDTITGFAGNDTLLGGIGDDYLDGGTDNDVLLGDAGNDTLLGMAGNDALDGGADNDKLDGGAGADTLNGGNGADTLIGGDGNDVYFVDNIGDRVIELAKSTSGKDSVKSSIDYTLPTNVENLELTGLANLNGTGNAADNKISGNEGDNLLNGGDGFDTLMGGDGDDTLNGGNGADTLIGGNGSDTYQINSKEDRIIETLNGGDQDVVESSVSYTLGDYLEVLTLTGSKTVNGTGNALDNTVEGNAADNTLNGEAGDDTLTGNAGDDTLEGGVGDDEIDGGEGDDQVVYAGNQSDYQITLDEDGQTWVIANINGDEGTDRLSHIETLRFADGVITPSDTQGLPRLSVDDISLNEGDSGTKTANFVFTLSAAASQIVSVDFQTSDDTAESGSDYQPQSGTLSFQPGETRKSIAITVYGDTLPESNETFLLLLGNPLGMDLETGFAAATLLNDERPRLSIASTSVKEGNNGLTEAQVTVTLSTVATTPVTVEYATADSTANAASDYNAAQGSLSFAPGETRKTFSVFVKGDTLKETDEKIRVLLKNPVGATLDTTATFGYITVTDDDANAQPVLTLTSDKTSFKAGDTAQLTFTFNVVPKGFTASDISVTGGTLGILSADSTGLIYTARYTPNTASDHWTGGLSLAANSYTDAAGTPGTVTNSLNFTGDTLAPSLTLSSDKATLKAGETATLSFNFSETPIGFTRSDIDISAGTLGMLTADASGKTYTAPYTPPTGTAQTTRISVAAGTYTDVLGNSGVASNALSLDTGKPVVVVPTLTISDVTVAEGNSGTRNATVTVGLSAVTSQTVTVNYATQDGTATAGSDYSAASSSLTFAPGETSKTISIPVIGDTTVESNETFQVQLSAAANAVLSTTASAATVTITNDDQAVISITGTTVTEGNSGTSNANVTVSLSAASSQTITVNYATLDGTATAGSDYAATSSSLTFAPGETSKIVSIPIYGDTTVESNETFQVQLSAAANAVLSTTASAATVTITNDDRLTPTVTVASNTSTLKAGDTATLTFTFNVIPIGFTASDISLSGGSVGGLSVDVTGQVYTATFTPTANTNSLNASISVVANSYTDSAGYNGAASNSLSLSGDTQAPTLTSSTPADNATGVALSSNLVLTFSETVQAGTGNIILSNGTDTRSISISDTSQVTFTGNTVTINPTTDLLGGGNYYLQLASGVIRDAAGNAYAGISDTTTLNVTTQATTGGIQATLTGTSGNDTLNGGTVNDALYGLAGEDLLNGYGGDDWLEGGEGYDQLYGGLGADTLVGGAVTGVDNTYNTLSGGAGNDSLIGGTYQDYLRGEDGNDTILGGGGDDTIDGGAGNDSMMGGVGNDRIVDLGYGSNWIDAGDGDDTILVGYSTYPSYSTNDITTITGGAGRDIYTLYGYGASLVITDFAVGAGGDTLDINEILTSRSTGYTSGNPFGSLGYLRVQQEGADTVLQWDSDGAAGNSATWQTQARLQNLTASSLTGANFAPQAAPDGSEIGVSLTGTTGNDTLNGGAVNDTLYGLAGEDLLNGYGGDDWLEGGEGYDQLYGGLGADTLVGGAVTGVDNTYNTLSGGAGNDSLIGGTYQDYLRGEDGNDTILGGGGDDTIDGGAGNDSMMGGVGNDRIVDLGYGSNWIDAGDGDDTILVGYSTYPSYSTNDITTITGGAGRDIYTLYGYGASLVIADFAVGAGGDTLDINEILTSRSTGYTSGNPFGSLGYLRVQQEGADTVLQWDRDGAAGNSATWQTQARLQNLTASRLTGANFAPQAAPDGSEIGVSLTGTTGNDTLNGGAVNDTLYGLAGEDLLNGYGGDDWLEGGEGYDQLYGGLGADTLVGGAVTGVDNTYNTLSGGAGNDSLIGGTYQDYLRGEDGNDTILGGGGDDTIDGGAGNDSMMGGVGNDRIVDPGYGSNWIDAGDGDDTILVGYSTYPSYSTNDSTTITGGGGRDIYTLYGYGASLVITDFAVGAGGDTLDINTILTRSTNYTSGNPFGSLGYLRVQQEGADTVLQWDSDGAAGNSATWQTQARLQNLTASSLTGANFAPQTPPDGSPATSIGLTGITQTDTNVPLALIG